MGCLNSAYYITKLVTQRNILEEYSQSAGATNAGRILGKSGFTIILIIDILRGYISVELGNYLNGSDALAGIFLFFCILGHIHPIQLTFNGGKGAACAIGGAIAISPLIACVCISFFGLLYFITKKKNLSGVLSFAFFPIFCFFYGINITNLISLTVMIILIIYTYHRKRKTSRSN